MVLVTLDCRTLDLVSCCCYVVVMVNWLAGSLARETCESVIDFVRDLGSLASLTNLR